MTNRQTISYLTQRFAEAGIRPVTRNGQNFLVDLNLVELLVESAALDQRDVVLEVGTGTGSLTAMMAKLAGHVVTVEIDGDFLPLLTEVLRPHGPRATLILGDALASKHRINPAVIEALRAGAPDYESSSSARARSR